MVWAGQPACVHRKPRTEGNSRPILDQFQMTRDSVDIMISLDVSVQLRGNGLRVTAPRLSVLRWLAGHTADVDCAVNHRPCLTPSEGHGYLLDEAEVVFWGICPSCQASAHNDDTKPIRYEEARQ